MIQGLIHMVSTLAGIWVCVSSIAGIDAGTLWCWMLKTPPLSRFPLDTLIQPSTVKPLRSRHKSSNLQKTFFYPSFWISTHPYPSTHSALSLSILTFCCCFQRRSQQFPTAKSPLSFKALFTPPSSTCAYMCACVWQNALLEGVQLLST